MAGALSSLGLTEADIAGGLYDGAAVETWLVDWTGPETRLLIDLATIGEVRREGDAFVAELRGLTHRLDAERGRTYRATCGADLGDARCRVELAPVAHHRPCDRAPGARDARGRRWRAPSPTACSPAAG